MFMIEDQRHSEAIATFEDRADALAALHWLADLPWDDAPNRAPCTGWSTCGRTYQLIEYVDDSSWSELARDDALEVSAAGIVWL